MCVIDNNYYLTNFVFSGQPEVKFPYSQISPYGHLNIMGSSLGPWEIKIQRILILIEDIDRAEEYVNRDLKSISSWFTDNGFISNTKKSEVMLVGTNHAVKIA